MLQAVTPHFEPDARDREAQLLADLVRLSPATVLLAESGADKSSFLSDCVMPLLATAAAGETEICVLFDRWTTEPLPALLAQIRRAIPVLDQRSAAESVPSASLVATLARWQATLGATFIIILDRLEEHLVARDRPGGPEFENELVRVLTTPELHTHFVMALEEDSASLLELLRQRIPGLGDTTIRLSRPTTRIAPGPRARLTGAAPPREPLAGSMARREPSAAALEDSGPAAISLPATALSEPPVPETPLSETPSLPQIPLSDTRVSETPLPQTHLAQTPFAPMPPARETLGTTEIADGVNAEAPPRAEGLTVAAASGERFWTIGRVPRAAWGVLGLLIVSALGLLLLAIWQPKPQAPEVASQPVPSAASADVGSAGSPGTPAKASAQETPAPSPADDQVALPLIKREVPRTESPSASAHPAKAPAKQAAPVPRPIAMVYIHVRSDAQRAWAEQLVQPLARRGVRVTGIRVVSVGPGAADLRYFRRQEAGEAARVARALHEVGMPQPHLKRVSGLESRATPRQYELWLPAGTPAPPQAIPAAKHRR